MSTLPPEAVAACREARTAFEPSSERLRALHHKIVCAAQAGTRTPHPEHDVAPAHLKVATKGFRLAYLFGTLSVLLAAWLVLRPDTHEPPSVSSIVSPPSAVPRPQPRALSIPIVSRPLPSAEPIVSTESAPNVVEQVANAPVVAIKRRVEPARKVQTTKPAREHPQALSELIPLLAATTQKTGAQSIEHSASAADQAVVHNDDAQRSSAPSTAQSKLNAELALLADARAQLKRGAVAEALALLASHETRFPSGQLHAERLALQARAHCAAQNANAARATYRELTLLHSASLESAVRRACGTLLAP